MGFFNKLKELFFKKKLETIEQKETNKKEKTINTKINTNTQNIGQVEKKEIVKEFDDEEIYFEDLWEYLELNKNTQAFHLLSVIGFDEWVDMEEIRNRIKQMFFIEYKNEKSLYPYIKTLTDVGLLETTSVGGKRKWKKKELIIKLKPKIKIEQKVKQGLKEKENK